MHINKIIITLIAFTILSCEPRGYNFNEGELPDNPVNLVDFNSEYDDYNSTAPSLGQLIPFCFSTNRISHGNDFDVIYMPMNVNFSKTSGLLKVTNEYSNWGIYQEEYDIIENGLSRINSTSNEFGPYLLYNHNSGFIDSDFLLLYASDISGNFEINFTYNKETSDFSESNPISYLNTEFNDLYPTLNSDFSKIFFCSDRENEKFNIFFVDVDIADNEIIKALSDTIYHEVFKDTIVSSNYDDKCAYIFDNMLVFASNKPGGYGGFDLYYSILVDGNWDTPINFGSKINTEFDEYRPILFNEGVDENKHMMVFSSNRIGGKGGFDLYFVGVRKNY